MIYLDNAAGSFPKPEAVYEAADRAMRERAGNPGRSGHKLSLAALRAVDEARMLCARLFASPSPQTIVFTSCATIALNMALKGVVKAGDHVITSSLEHNSVSRPLFHLQGEGVEVTKLPADIETGLEIADIKNAIKANTKMIVCTHVSNVTGTVNDIAAIGSLCREKGIVFLVDAAQSAGAKRIDVQEMGIDLLAFPGHKGLLGPQGTGGLYIRAGLALKTIIQGGTGSDSASPQQPEDMPGKFESGTLNVPALAGLAAGVRFVLEKGAGEIEKREAALTGRLIEGIGKISGARLIGPAAGGGRGSVVSVCFENAAPDAAALLMDSAFDIAVRGGLHCAPDAHRSIGTFDGGGTLRVSANYFNTEAEIDACLEALELCAKSL